MCEAVVESGELVHHVDLHLDRDARHHPLAEGLRFYAGAPVRTPEGQVLGTLCVADTQPREFDARERLTLEDLAETVTDLLRHERTERQRDEILGRLTAISEAPHLIIIEIDGDGIICHASPSVEGIMGYAPSQIQGRSFLEFVHPDARDQLANEYAVIVTGVPNEGESEFIARDGSYRTLAWSICPEAAPSETSHAVTILRDVSERVRAQREVAEAAERHRQLFATSRDAMALTLPDSGQATDVNNAFCELLGYTVDEVRGMDLERLRISEASSQAEMQSRLDDLVERGFTDEWERVFRTKGGEEVPVSVCAWMLRDVQGNPASILTRIRDIREERARERMQSRLQEELEERVRARTRELEETLNRLQAAERLASVGTLASGVAHQINNPIGAILAASELALMCEDEDDFKETWRRALMDAVEQSRRCGRIVRSMLQYSQGTRRGGGRRRGDFRR